MESRGKDGVLLVRVGVYLSLLLIQGPVVCAYTVKAKAAVLYQTM
jgi:hypothetical protein